MPQLVDDVVRSIAFESVGRRTFRIAYTAHSASEAHEGAAWPGYPPACRTIRQWGRQGLPMLFPRPAYGKQPRPLPYSAPRRPFRRRFLR
jgi:hypothetical protein